LDSHYALRVLQKPLCYSHKGNIYSVQQCWSLGCSVDFLFKWGIIDPNTSKEVTKMTRHITRHAIPQGTFFVEQRGEGYSIRRHGELYPTVVIGEEQSGYWWAGRTAPVAQYQRELIALHTAA
jgi:hypothetical protein